MDIKIWLVTTSGLIGGLGMFLYGMTLMSDGLQKTAGENLKKILAKLTSNRLIGTGVGIGVTVLIQSSSATTVMVVGFVNAGLMSLTQALSVILGANIGTTITAQIIAFNITAIALPMLGIGALVNIFSKKDRLKCLSEIVLGFGLLFFGMSIMTKAFAPLKDLESFRMLFTYFSSYPVLTVLVGVVTTMILQSSSAVIAITMALASTGLLDLPSATALVLGDNIGTTITANLAAMSGSRTAKQAALGHFLFNAIGVVLALVLLKPFIHLITVITPGDPTYVNPATGTLPYAGRHIANAHTFFNVINTIIFLPLLPFLAKLCEKLITTDAKQQYEYTQLSNALMKTPEIAVSQVQQEVTKLSAIMVKLMNNVDKSIDKWDQALLKKVEKHEEDVDGYQKEILNFIDIVEKKNLSRKTSQLLAEMKQAVMDMEEIADLTKKMIKSAIKMAKKEQIFSDSAKKELNEMVETVTAFATGTFAAFSMGKPQTENDLAIEDDVDKMHKQYRKNHIKRLGKEMCDFELGIVFVEILSYLESIGDHVFNIAQINMKRNKTELQTENQNK